MSTHDQGGRHRCSIRDSVALRYGIDLSLHHHFLTDKLMAQLSFCRSEEARRLILGIRVPVVSESGRSSRGQRPPERRRRPAEQP